MAAAALLWGGSATVLQLLRQEGAPAVDTIWAEDGSEFLQWTLDQGLGGALFEPYAGYLHVLPRLVGGAVGLAPPGSFAAGMAVSASVIVSALSLYVWFKMRSFSLAVSTRILLVAMTALLPALGWESTGNATNLQWSLVFPCFLALLPGHPSAVLAGSLIAFVAASSAPTTMLLLPMAIWSLRDESAASRLTAGSFLVGLGLQLVVSVQAGADPFGLPTSLLDLPGLYGLRVAGSLFAGEALLPAVWRTLGWAYAFGALVLAGAVVANGALRLPGRRASILAAAVASVALFSFPVFVRGTSLLAPSESDFVFHGSKWTIGPILLLAMALLISLEPRNPGSIPPGRRSARIALIVLLMLGTILGFRVWTPRSEGPPWSEELATAQSLCRREALERVEARISPVGWMLTLPCDRLVASSQGVPPVQGRIPSLLRDEPIEVGERDAH